MKLPGWKGAIVGTLALLLVGCLTACEDSGGGGGGFGGGHSGGGGASRGW